MIAAPFTTSILKLDMPHPRLTALCLACAILMAAPTVQAQSAASGTPAPGARQVITSAEQLPRRVVKLDKLPSQYLEAPRAEV